MYSEISGGSACFKAESGLNLKQNMMYNEQTKKSCTNLPIHPEVSYTVVQ